MGLRSPGRSGGRLVGAPGRGRWKIGWPGTGRPGTGRVVMPAWPDGAPAGLGAPLASTEPCKPDAVQSGARSFVAAAPGLMAAATGAAGLAAMIGGLGRRRGGSWCSGRWRRRRCMRGTVPAAGGFGAAGAAGAAGTAACGGAGGAGTVKVGRGVEVGTTSLGGGAAGGVGGLGTGVLAAGGAGVTAGFRLNSAEQSAAVARCAAGACCLLMMAFNASPGLEIWERSILVLISSASDATGPRGSARSRRRTGSCGGAHAPCPLRGLRENWNGSSSR